MALLSDAHQRAHRAPARPQEGPSLAPRPAEASRPAPPVPQLPAEEGPRPVPRAHQGARPPPLTRSSVGHDAPDFTLRDQDGKKVTLSELRGQTIVLVFYPLDWSARSAPTSSTSTRTRSRDFTQAGRDALRRLGRLGLQPQGVPGPPRASTFAAARRLRAQGRGRAQVRHVHREARARTSAASS